MIGYEINDHYDVIYSMGALQFLPVEQRQKHFEKYMQHTCVGGLNAHLVFVEKPFIAVAPDWEENEFFYRSGDLAGYYYDWQIIHCEVHYLLFCLFCERRSSITWTYRPLIKRQRLNSGDCTTITWGFNVFFSNIPPVD